jgi:hypothetical protein
MLSSEYHEKSTQAITANEIKNKPMIIINYNKNKGGVDVLDRVISNFSCVRKTNRFKFFFKIN